MIGDYANGLYYIPLATTEGALVASVNRGGAKIITEAGGARSKVINDGMTRAPVIAVPSVIDAVELVNWVNDHFNELKNIAESTSRHARLLNIQPFIIGNNVWLRFRFATGDAMGMNMVTIATDKAVKHILSKFPRAQLVALSGNMCVDKKANTVNFLLGRGGKTVVSEAVIPRNTLEKWGGVTAEDVAEVNNRKNLLGSALAHSYGFNAHSQHSHSNLHSHRAGCRPGR